MPVWATPALIVSGILFLLAILVSAGLMLADRLKYGIPLERCRSRAIGTIQQKLFSSETERREDRASAFVLKYERAEENNEEYLATFLAEDAPVGIDLGHRVFLRYNPDEPRELFCETVLERRRAGLRRAEKMLHIATLATGTLFALLAAFYICRLLVPGV